MREQCMINSSASGRRRSGQLRAWPLTSCASSAPRLLPPMVTGPFEVARHQSISTARSATAAVQVSRMPIGEVALIYSPP
jgi:hypothetical protein